eukprot:TRINITY_DN2349_c0_g1_i1.p1 TRINITY_DN2349_c0_g1~~TRINITY_DN2349_c0_g1_i1.p1  ORF type:complete len:593 (+),score=134.18 TRINITY_DN2349_c0_g1_i1:89-1867(+)
MDDLRINSSSRSSAGPVVAGVTDKTVGVLGGGQLGRMLCQAATTLGVKIITLDPLVDAPSARIAHRHVVGSFRDAETIKEFAKRCDVLTFEIEHVNVDVLEMLEANGVDVEPKSATIRVIQDKYAQKLHFANYGVPLPGFTQLGDMEGVKAAGRAFGYPMMIKSRRNAYDGRGNAVARSDTELKEAVAALGGFEKGLYAEKWVPYVKELAVMVARDREGNVISYPVVETTHKDNICLVVEAPAAITVEVAGEARVIAERAVASLTGAGVFGVELFLLSNGSILLNEVAPRAHNSGHYTIEACVTSQFEQHLRAILGLPLGLTKMKVPASVMYNILGEDDGEEGMIAASRLLRRAVATPGASIHWYTKPEIRKARKMGHITVVGEDSAVVRKRVAQFAPQAFPELSSGSEPSAEQERESLPEVPKIGIIMGSDSDLPVMKSAAATLHEFKIPHEMTIVSAHRTPDRLAQYARGAHLRGIRVIIAGAGGAAHLPGMVASMTPLPVIGVPVKATALDGLDSLLSICQMPRGIPVATVAINNAMNAALLAIRIISCNDMAALDRVVMYQEEMEKATLAKAAKLEKIGWERYMTPGN